ncbi:UDP:flavonoid glycosyltransferase YjiC (YdhE family) [Saccharopolyspora lacisalsi]|uniref:UDP:flavonoid glycosyltransferase YjiC (YdhE family) n=1 Tax=Halosaccharopolyspora lacisalsi TaxID=1000566 RepID=A0A839E146_9PSEU|nr:nucleotide disphospho-sugar-binding domain-containing protein [Halosaccharopolyspora lacisalsi]MBA8827514.1 UDP:flavonoid glycosyltransferase YjiC (YdhE family) [Halosaccharopolyspora lacisalsi]
MRVVFAVSDYRPHYYPMVPLGWALQAAGHEVRVVCAPKQAPLIDSAGLTPVPLLDDVDLLKMTRVWNHWQQREGLAPEELELPALNPMTGAELDRLEDFDWAEFPRDEWWPGPTMGQRIRAMVGFVEQWRPGLVVHDLLYLDPVVAARDAGIPSICHLTGPIGTTETEWGLDFVPQWFSEEFDNHEVPRDGEALIDRVVDICPPSMSPPTNALRLPMRYIPYNGPGSMPLWAQKRSHKPRVCIMWSNTLVHLYGSKSFVVPTLLAALADLDVEVVLTMNADALSRLGPIPANVRALEHCPVHILQETTDLMVHSAGAGALLTAAAAGVPQLLVTFGAEYRANGRRLAATGAGVQLDGVRINAETVRESAITLLDDPSYRHHAQALRREMYDMPTPADSVRGLESIAAGAE